MKNKRWTFSKNTWKYHVFCIFGNDGISISYKYDITLLSKKQRWSSSEKIHLKNTFLASLKMMIFILENMVFLLIEKLRMIKKFTWGLYRRFHILLSNKKPRKLTTWDWNLISSLSYMVGEILQWRIFNTLYYSTLKSCI